MQRFASLRDAPRVGVVALVCCFACTQRVLEAATLGEEFLGTGGATSASGDLSCDNLPRFELPSGSAFGEARQSGELPTAHGDYTTSAGPGVSVVARDAFRLYVNGHLVHESDAPRGPVFVPLVFPPGDNVVALEIVAHEGTPAALVHIDELRGAIVSDGTWRYSVAPSADWQLASFDDREWEQAERLVSLGDLPGCDPGHDFPLGSSASWIGPRLGFTGPVALRKTVRVASSGFAEGTTGGGAETPQIVSAWDELAELVSGDENKVILIPEGVHDFRRGSADTTEHEACPVVCPNDPERKRFAILPAEETCDSETETITLDDRVLVVGSNTTILGLGRGAVLRGVTVLMEGKENVILRNLGIFDINPEIMGRGDALRIDTSEYVWVSHLTMREVGDRFVHISGVPTKVSLSFLHLDGRRDDDCEGRHPGSVLLSKAEVSISNTRFDHLRQSAPAANGAGTRVHLFNNSYSNVTGWAVDSACTAVVLAEGNTFENVEAIARASDCGEDTVLGLLNFPSGSNLYRDGAPTFLGGDGSEPTESEFSPPYEVQVEPASSSWPIVVSRAGAGGPWALPFSVD